MYYSIHACVGIYFIIKADYLLGSGVNIPSFKIHDFSLQASDEMNLVMCIQ